MLVFILITVQVLSHYVLRISSLLIRTNNNNQALHLLKIIHKADRKSTLSDIFCDQQLSPFSALVLLETLRLIDHRRDNVRLSELLPYYIQANRHESTGSDLKAEYAVVFLLINSIKKLELLPSNRATSQGNQLINKTAQKLNLSKESVILLQLVLNITLSGKNESRHMIADRLFNDDFINYKNTTHPVYKSGKLFLLTASKLSPWPAVLRFYTSLIQQNRKAAFSDKSICSVNALALVVAVMSDRKMEMNIANIIDGSNNEKSVSFSFVEQAIRLLDTLCSFYPTNDIDSSSHVNANFKFDGVTAMDDHHDFQSMYKYIAGLLLSSSGSSSSSPPPQLKYNSWLYLRQCIPTILEAFQLDHLTISNLSSSSSSSSVLSSSSSSSSVLSSSSSSSSSDSFISNIPYSNNDSTQTILRKKSIRKIQELLLVGSEDSYSAIIDFSSQDETNTSIKRMNNRTNSTVTSCIIFGDGDISFSVALIHSLCKTYNNDDNNGNYGNDSIKTNYSVRIVSTSYESRTAVENKYLKAASNIEYIQKQLYNNNNNNNDKSVSGRLDTSVIFSVDVQTFRSSDTFDISIFNFPFADVEKELMEQSIGQKIDVVENIGFDALSTTTATDVDDDDDSTSVIMKSVTDIKTKFDTQYIYKGRHMDLLTSYFNTSLAHRCHTCCITLLLSQAVTWEIERIAANVGYKLLMYSPLTIIYQDILQLGYERKRSYLDKSFPHDNDDDDYAQWCFIFELRSN